MYICSVQVIKSLKRKI